MVRFNRFLGNDDPWRNACCTRPNHFSLSKQGRGTNHGTAKRKCDERGERTLPRIAGSPLCLQREAPLCRRTQRDSRSNGSVSGPKAAIFRSKDDTEASVYASDFAALLSESKWIGVLHDILIPSSVNGIGIVVKQLPAGSAIPQAALALVKVLHKLSLIDTDARVHAVDTVAEGEIAIAIGPKPPVH